MKSTHAILLASTALLAVSAIAPPAPAATLDRAFIVAQAASPTTATDAADPKRDHARDKDKRHKDKAEANKRKVEQLKPTAPGATPPAAIAKPAQTKPPQLHSDERRPQNRDGNLDRKAPVLQPPAAAAAPAKPVSPIAQKPADKLPAPTLLAPAEPAPAAQNKQAAPPPAAAVQPNTKPAAVTAAVPMPPPTKAHDAGEFIRRDGQKQGRSMDDVRKNRRETRDGNRLVIQEGNRTIEREGQRTIIRHNEADRFSVGARDVKVERRGNETVSIVVRPNGISIVSTTDHRGHLIRRVRRDRHGREVVIIDNGFAGARRGDFFINLAPPVIRLPRDHYIVDAGHASAAQIYDIFTAQPVERIERRYTVDQVRYNDPLRARMPRIDLDVNFDTGSWQLTPDQVGGLSAIAHGLNRAIKHNPREVFLIEGHTDAVGSADDNLSLSDRRAETVAVALTEQFQVPPENLVTQGYGEEYLKVATDGAERTNRRVAVRRITPLIEQAKTIGSGRSR